MNVKDELAAATDRILSSGSQKKLIVAGPGAGKTFIFNELLKQSGAPASDNLVLTFINELKADLVTSLGDLSKVMTLHGYCLGLLKTDANLRAGLTSDFECLPGLASLIANDWEYIHHHEAPHFVRSMRMVTDTDVVEFYLRRGDYYNAVDFDDSVYRVFLRWRSSPSLVSQHALVLVDEFQDFNNLEASIITMLADRNFIVVAGDDDQALYTDLRSASADFIRNLHKSGHFEVFQLPFCMRCPEVLVGAVNDVVATARSHSHLNGRIEKQYRYYEPQKGSDSARYPHIDWITASVQRTNANYLGRYIAEEIRRIPTDEVAEALEKGFPPILVIASNPYRAQIEAYLRDEGFEIRTKVKTPDSLTREAGLRALQRDPSNNLGWRMVLFFDEPTFTEDVIRRTYESQVLICDVVPDDWRDQILAEANALAAPEQPDTTNGSDESKKIPVRVVTFEGAKGLSAQHVFIVGMHEGELPRKASHISDLEICKFLVALTRAKKKCTILTCKRFGQDQKAPSVFLSWIAKHRFNRLNVDASYWANET